MPAEKLRIVLDTNVILNALSPRLPFRSILKDLVSGKYEIYVTTEILLEYEEKITEFYGKDTATLILDTFSFSNHVNKIEVYYHLNLVGDPDDNKFSDCAFAANAHFLVSDDKVFRKLKSINFPSIPTLTLDRFFELLQI